jgi:hypothetical protein
MPKAQRVVNFIFESWLEAWNFSRDMTRAGGLVYYRSVKAPWTVTVSKRHAELGTKLAAKFTTERCQRGPEVRVSVVC